MGSVHSCVERRLRQSSSGTTSHVLRSKFPRLNRRTDSARSTKTESRNLGARQECEEACKSNSGISRPTLTTRQMAMVGRLHEKRLLGQRHNRREARPFCSDRPATSCGDEVETLGSGQWNTRTGSETRRTIRTRSYADPSAKRQGGYPPGCPATRLSVPLPIRTLLKDRQR